MIKLISIDNSYYKSNNKNNKTLVIVPTKDDNVFSKNFIVEQISTSTLIRISIFYINYLIKIT